MPDVNLENMGVGGLLRDQPDHAIAPEYWSDGNNVRFENGKVSKVLGESELYPAWKKIVIVSSTTTAVSPVAFMTDNTVNFLTLGVTAGNHVHNTTDDTWSSVAGSVGIISLQLVDDILSSASKNYIIYIQDNLGTHAGSVPLWLMPWRDATATGYWLLHTVDTIVRLSSSAALDVTRTASDYNCDADTIWSGGVLGAIPIVNNDFGTDIPQSWDTGTTKFVDLPNWTAGDTCRIMRMFKQYAIAMDITRGGIRQPHTLKWSSPATPGAIPDFWDNADSNDSNEAPLSEGGGFIVDALPLGDLNIIYKEERTHAMQHIGGEFVFRLFKLPFETGMLAPRCAKEIKGQHLVVTADDIILHNAQEARSIVDSINRNYFFDNLERTKSRKTFIVPNYKKSEMWICFVSTGVNGNYADEALIWNYKDNTFGHKVLNDVPHIGYGLLDKSGLSSIIDDQAQIIDSDTSIVDGSFFSLGQLGLLGSQVVTPNSKLVEYDSGNLNIDTMMMSHIERTGITIVGQDRQGNPKVSATTTKLHQRIYPKLDSTGPVNIYVGYQQKLEGSVTYEGPFVFDPDTDNHIDVILQGKALCFKITSLTDISWSASGATMVVEVIGESNR